MVFTTPEDPVASGLVPSLSHPGGNLTGINLFIGELMSKRLELLGAMLPRMVRIAVFVNPANPARAEAQVKEAESAVAGMGVQVCVFQAGTIQQINAAFATFATTRPMHSSSVPIPITAFGARNSSRWRRAMPSRPRFSVRDFVEAGGLMSYGTNIVIRIARPGSTPGAF